ncbi:MAG: histidinol dehydrogenase [Betaproteobacteria bacterium]|jgi:histidinol dehydrogenase|nr:histidinol dehydrogenase [Pseudomonadota bacterium]NBO05076.1 histidinol dehydrogenase [Betaproteobacteria bacterium]HAB48219.1 histidinol dehydrogenase [Lautropia sp.]NBP34286.1 histidinol dehydrogenase [Betaproteobacteria bacterium]NBP37933.1 histidinol dehydrogenase [Betaproteobacteria bacterium]
MSQPSLQALAVNRLNTADANFEQRFAALLAWEDAKDQAVEAAVSAIIQAVRKEGDTAVLRYTERFDRLRADRLADLEIPLSVCHQALADLPADQAYALEAAHQRIKSFHEKQLSPSWSYLDEHGSRFGQMVTALDRVGLYVPGGKAAYPSSVLMNAVPAKVAGVGELLMVVPTPDGQRNALVLAAAALAQADRVFTIGGAQAIAALAYGTETITAVDKITGPGNAYVAEAKRRVFGKVGIDMIAGPSEILVLCDGQQVDPDWVAMDLFSQAEHDELAQAILLCPDADFIERVHQSLSKLVLSLPRRAVIERSMADRGMLVKVRDMQEACELANQVAAEHLEIIAQNPELWAGQIRHAGALFLGPWASESLGDYCAGPNHVLPTMRTARFSSPLGVYDFQKRSSLIQMSEQGAKALGPLARCLAQAEGLQAHAASAAMRL